MRVLILSSTVPFSRFDRTKKAFALLKVSRARYVQTKAGAGQDYAKVVMAPRVK